MAKLPDYTALGPSPTPSPSRQVASYQPTTGFEGSGAASLATGAQNLKEASAAFQQVRQSELETQVNDTYANQYAPFVADAWQKYHSLQGKDAVDGLQDYVKSISDQREKLRDTLPGSFAQQMFDQQARRRIESELNSAAIYADQQQKVYDLTTHQATLKSYLDQAADKADDPKSFQMSLNSAAMEIERFGLRTGQSDEVRKQAYSNFRSSAITGMLQRMSLSDPEGAMAMYLGTKDAPGLSQYVDAGTRPALEAHLTERSNNDEQSRLVQTLLFGGQFAAKDGTKFDINPNLPIDQREQQAITIARDYAKEAHPNDARFEDTLLSRLRSDAGQLRWQQRLATDDAISTVYAGLTDQNGNPRSLGDALNDPTWAAQYNALSLKDQGRIRTAALQTENFLTPEKARLVDQVKGLAFTDPQAFLNYDVGSLVGKIPQAQVESIINMKAAINRKDASQQAHDLNLTTALGSVKDMMPGNQGNVAGTAQGKDMNNQFVGAFDTQLEAYKTANGKYPDHQTRRLIAADLLKSISQPGSIFGSFWPNQTPKYQLPKTEDEVKDLSPGQPFLNPADGKVYIKH